MDLRGFGDSDNAPGDYDTKTSAEDLHHLIEHLNVGPVHLTGQDISGATVFRLATTHPEDVLSLTAIEMGLPGFGLERLADVTHGGAWHIGVLAAPGIPEMLLAGREREFLGQFAFPAMSAIPGAITDTDIDDFVRTYSRPDGWRGATGLYQSMLRERAPNSGPSPSRPDWPCQCSRSRQAAAIHGRAPCPRPRRRGSAPSSSTALATTPPWRPRKSWRGPSSASSTASTPPRSLIGISWLVGGSCGDTL